VTEGGPLLAGALAGALLLTGCSVGVPPATDGASAPVQQSRVDVDTPELRAAKADAGIEPCEAVDAPPADADPLPEVTLPCLGGGPAVDLSGLRGPAVVNLFAQWCEPCREELPYYQRLHEQGGRDVRVLGIDYLDTQPDGALALAADTGVTYPLLADPDGVLRSEFRIRGLPGVVFVDAEGRVAHVEFTVIRSYRQLTDLVEEHLGVSL
jgi:thiol-disulfide isomerase/thioredoxin